jgi:hypothetical protein
MGEIFSTHFMLVLIVLQQIKNKVLLKTIKLNQPHQAQSQILGTNATTSKQTYKMT